MAKLFFKIFSGIFAVLVLWAGIMILDCNRVFSPEKAGFLRFPDRT